MMMPSSTSGASGDPPTGGAGRAALVPYIHPRSRPGPKLAKGDATTTPPYALGFTERLGVVPFLDAGVSTTVIGAAVMQYNDF